MNIRVQSLNSNPQMAYKSLQGAKKPIKRIVPFAFATLLTASLLGCGQANKDTYESTTDNTTATVSNPERIDNVNVCHFDHTGDAVYIKRGEKTTRIQFDNDGNLYGEYTNYKDGNGNNIFDTYHRLLNGKTSLDAYHVIQRGDKNTTIIERFDRDGDLISKDSTVYEKEEGIQKLGSSKTYITLGPSKLNDKI